MILREHVLDAHGDRRANTRERIDHQSDQGAVAEADDGRRVDRIDELAGLGGIKHRRLAAPHDMARPAHGGGRIGRHDLADHHPVEQVAQCGQAELGGRRGSRLAQLLDVGGNMLALDRRELRDAFRLKPVEEFRRGARIGAAGVRVADVGGEEFEEAIRRARTGGGDQGRSAKATTGQAGSCRERLSRIEWHLCVMQFPCKVRLPATTRIKGNVCNSVEV